MTCELRLRVFERCIRRRVLESPGSRRGRTRPGAPRGEWLGTTRGCALRDSRTRVSSQRAGAVRIHPLNGAQVSTFAQQTPICRVTAIQIDACCFEVSKYFALRVMAGGWRA